VSEVGDRPKRAGVLKALWASGVAVLSVSAAARADEFLALPGLWMTSYVVRGKPDSPPRAPKVVWHCVAEETDPWVSFAQLHDLPGMTCTRQSLQRTRTSLKWQTQCLGPGAAASADVVNSEGSIVFDSPQHYTGWMRFSGALMGYPLESISDIEGRRHAACTSPED
jgi:hypothetical protein